MASIALLIPSNAPQFAPFCAPGSNALDGIITNCEFRMQIPCAQLETERAFTENLKSPYAGLYAVNLLLIEKGKCSKA